jgi:hypothetical protein
MDAWQIVFALLMGFSLAATCGLRAFLPLLIIGIGARADLVTLSQGFDWMQSYPALICFGTAALLEILGDKIPAVDHALDVGGVFVRPIAGAIAASSLIKGFDPLITVVIGIIIGSGVAGIVHWMKGTLRLLSSATTAGLANPAISVAEDGAVAAGGIMGLFFPYVVGLVAIVLLIVGGRIVLSGIRRKKKVKEPAQVIS